MHADEGAGIIRDWSIGQTPVYLHWVVVIRYCVHAN